MVYSKADGYLSDVSAAAILEAKAVLILFLIAHIVLGQTIQTNPTKPLGNAPVSLL